MALNYGIFESEFVGLDTNNVPMYDRAVDETFLELYCGGFFTDGVAVFVENCFQVISELDNQITINPGIALLEGKMAYDLLSDTISLPDSPADYSRYDRVVLRRDNIARTISIEFISGDENAAPVKPDLTRTENVYELSLATILRSPNDTVTQADITDDRLNTSLCGVIGPKTNVLDTEDLFAQFTAIFTEWFNDLGEVLDENAAANLLAEINKLKFIQTATGTGTAITLTGVEFEDGFVISFVIAQDNESGATTINGKSLYKPNTTDVPTLTAGESVTIWYDLTNDCFYLKNDTNDLYQQQLADRREILDIKLKLDELNVSEFLNKTGIGFFDLFEDNSNIDITNTTATIADTDVSFSGEQLLKFNDETFESFSDLELAVYDLEREAFVVDVDVSASATISMNITPGSRVVGEKFWFNGQIYTITGVTEL